MSAAAATGDGMSGGQAEVDAIRPQTEETPAPNGHGGERARDREREGEGRGNSEREVGGDASGASRANGSIHL
jgi:hypothetical protein